MFTLTFFYPDGYPGGGAQETVRASYIPQIGMKIMGSSSRCGSYIVTEVSSSIEDSILSDHVYVTLEEDID